jgi:hypothetical protein
VSEELDPASRAAVAGERATLEGFLEFFRDEIVRKVSGVSEADARRALVPSKTTLAGLVRHLTAVERHWFLRRLDERPEESIPANSWGDDDSWDLGPADTVESLLTEYRAVCAESREVAARFADLDHTVPHPGLGRITFRWIYVHMIEETGRHAGHADILREQIDGSVG